MWSLVLDEPFGLVLPSLHEFLSLAIVGDGPLQESSLLGRYRAMYELTIFHVSPFVVRAVTCLGVLGAAAAWFAAFSCVATACLNINNPWHRGRLECERFVHEPA